MKNYNVINVQTGLIDYTNTYDACLAYIKEALIDMGAVLSTPNDYFRIELSKP